MLQLTWGQRKCKPTSINLWIPSHARNALYLRAVKHAVLIYGCKQESSRGDREESTTPGVYAKESQHDIHAFACAWVSSNSLGECRRDGEKQVAHKPLVGDISSEHLLPGEMRLKGTFRRRSDRERKCLAVPNIADSNRLHQLKHRLSQLWVVAT